MSRFFIDRPIVAMVIALRSTIQAREILSFEPRVQNGTPLCTSTILSLAFRSEGERDGE